MQDKIILGVTGGIASTLTSQLAPTGASLVLETRNTSCFTTPVKDLFRQILRVTTDITATQQLNTSIEKAIAEFRLGNLATKTKITDN